MEEGKTWPRRLKASRKTRARNWGQEKESREVVTTETKQEPRDGGGKGGPRSDRTGKQKGLVGLSLRNLDRPPGGLREKQDIPTSQVGRRTAHGDHEREPSRGTKTLSPGGEGTQVKMLGLEQVRIGETRRNWA